MALRWLVHSACHVLGYGYPNQNKDVGSYQSEEGDDHGGSGDQNQSQSSKVSKGDEQLILSQNQSAEILHPSGFQMPLHYPRYTKADYDKMEEWKVDLLLTEYGLISFNGSLDEKRAYAMGAFLWPHQY